QGPEPVYVCLTWLPSRGSQSGKVLCPHVCARVALVASRPGKGHGGATFEAVEDRRIHPGLPGVRLPQVVLVEELEHSVNVVPHSLRMEVGSPAPLELGGEDSPLGDASSVEILDGAIAPLCH